MSTNKLQDTNPHAASVMCLSVRQPFAWAIVQGLKDTENRWGGFACTHHGLFLVHTGKECTAAEYSKGVARIHKVDRSIVVPPLAELPRGGIVGRARAKRYVRKSSSPWFDGPIGIELAEQRPMPFVKCGGALGWFHCPDEAFIELRRLVRTAMAT